jgi:hypothetical protein
MIKEEDEMDNKSYGNMLNPIIIKEMQSRMTRRYSFTLILLENI